LVAEAPQSAPMLWSHRGLQLAAASSLPPRSGPTGFGQPLLFRARPYLLVPHRGRSEADIQLVSNYVEGSIAGLPSGTDDAVMSNSIGYPECLVGQACAAWF
jgi:hypothetical protein